MSVLFANKLSTSFAYNEVEAVPDFGVGALVRNHSTGAVSQTPSATARQTRRNIDRAEACFITKRPSYTHETVHWVNAVKKNPDLKEKIVCSLSLRMVLSHSVRTGAIPLTPRRRSQPFQLERYQ